LCSPLLLRTTIPSSSSIASGRLFSSRGSSIPMLLPYESTIFVHCSVVSQSTCFTGGLGWNSRTGSRQLPRGCAIRSMEPIWTSSLHHRQEPFRLRCPARASCSRAESKRDRPLANPIHRRTEHRLPTLRRCEFLAYNRCWNELIYVSRTPSLRALSLASV
jgi:hypothetical protein